MKARKLPSGSWNCRVTDHYEIDKDGKKKRVYRSFTVDDPSKKGKIACEKMALEWMANKTYERERRGSDANMLVREAVERYIDIKRNVLSPSTIRGYKKSTVRMDPIADVCLNKLTTPMVQKWVNDMSAEISPKSVSNIYGLLAAVCGTFAPETTLRVKLPQKKIYHGYVPTDADIKALIEYVKVNDPDLVIPIYLAAFGTLRRSEICGLLAGDVDRHAGTVHVHRAMVERSYRDTVLKDTPKTSASDRVVQLPDKIIALLPTDGPITPLSPSVLSNRFARAVARCGLPHFRFHDLRHYAASIMHAIGIPDVYIMAKGGWSSDATLKRIYRGTMDDWTDHYNSLTLDHQNKLL